ncbi:MAG: hypothetical protein H6551_09250 [Chitinophagales bacterium]|nr:hypothetical protein [Chitinophagaceae bacterium]MCB9065308.1 hypothetical protein [Chitinophagales bacterium]
MYKSFALSMLLAVVTVVSFSSCSKGYKCDCTYGSERVIVSIDDPKAKAQEQCDDIRDDLYRHSKSVNCHLR